MVQMCNHVLMDGPREYVLYLRKSKGRAGVARQRTITTGYLDSIGAKESKAEVPTTDRTAYRR